VLKLSVNLKSFEAELKGQLKGTEQEIASSVTRAMRATAATMKDEARSQIRAAGMSQRLANTWRSNVYPEGRASLNPATYLWSAAPNIIDAFSSGQSITGRFGSGWLMIPTNNIPVGLRRRSRSAKSVGRDRSLPLLVEDYFKEELIFLRDRRGNLGAYVKGVAGRRAGTFKPATDRRKKGDKRNAPRVEQLIKMFSLVRRVTPRKVLDLDRIAQVGQQAFPGHLQDNWT
jgi:hypothetical protein